MGISHGEDMNESVNFEVGERTLPDWNTKSVHTQYALLPQVK